MAPPLPARRPRLESFDDSTGPATPYQPAGDSTADLEAYLESHDHDGFPQSGFRARSRFDRKMIIACAAAYALGALSTAAIFLALR
ncbi:MAG: hypothetical protein ABI183_23645 [Polyangiaceae bacterium]